MIKQSAITVSPCLKVIIMFLIVLANASIPLLVDFGCNMKLINTLHAFKFGFALGAGGERLSGSI